MITCAPSTYLRHRLSGALRRTYTATAGDGSSSKGGAMFGPRRVRQRWIACAVLVSAVALTASVASAQRKKISLEEIVIEGNIQKPEAFFILPRTSLNLEDLNRREDLKSRITRSVENAPF